MSKYSDQSIVKLSSFNEKIPPLKKTTKKAAGVNRASIIVDLCQSREYLHVEAELPGVLISDLKVEFSKNFLTIKGKKGEPNLDRSLPKKYLLLERGSGVFHRRIRLPKSINPRLSRITFNDGLLVLDIPLVSEKRRRRLTLNMLERKTG